MKQRADRPSVPARLDLGCGTAKCPGFIGADRFPLRGVDVIVDLDAPLPFRTDSVDLLVMSHALEHVRDLLATLKEVYRICRHGARVCVVAPYSHQALNLANPFHRHSFNEHTPRFWTDSPSTPVDPSEFTHPHAPEWGLSRSDHDDPHIDFRCVSLEFFYFPEYRRLPPDEQRAARKKFLDVCDQIVYQLVVVKKDIDAIGVEQLAHDAPSYEPPGVTLRKRDERIAALEAELALERAQAATARDERAAARARLDETHGELVRARQLLSSAREEAAATREQLQAARAELAESRSALARAEEARATTDARLAEAEQELAAARGLLAATREEAAATREQLERASRELSEARARVAQGREQAHAWEARARDAQGRLDEAGERLARTEQRLALWQHAGREASGESAALRSRRLLRALSRLRPGPDLLPQMNPAFQDLLDDSRLFLGSLEGYRLQPSQDLLAPGSVAYSLTLDRPNLSGVMLAPIVELPEAPGYLGIEVATPDGVTLARAQVALSEMDQHRPVRFMFPPVAESARRVVLRVDVQDAAAPVRLFEWRKRRFFGLHPLATRPFCALIFKSA